MTVMNFDLEDGLPPVSFDLKPDDAERFAAFMAECHAALAAAPTPTEQEDEPVKPFWPSVQEAINEYLEGYEYDDGESCHVPNAVESILIHDAISGLLEDEVFVERYEFWLSTKRRRAANDKLRKAAEALISYWDGDVSTGELGDRYIGNLRAALEGK